MDSQVTIVGAGPYGLSLAAHLEARKIPFRILGSPMEFWRTSMPRGMFLKSDGFASSIFDSGQTFTLSRYCAAENIPYDDLELPVSLEAFISYGDAFQQKMVPALEQRRVMSMKASDGGFSLTLDDGETFTSRKVILAIGIGYFSNVPFEFAGLEDTYITHSSQHADLVRFAGRDVAIIGAGSSALDLAALLDRAGAHPVLVTRGSSLRFHERQRLPRRIHDRLFAPSSGVGPGWISWLCCNAPSLFHRLPEVLRLRIVRSYLGPSGGWFIKDAVTDNIPVVYNSTVERVAVENNQVRLRLASQVTEPRVLLVDHVIAATGYKVDIDRIPFLDDLLRFRINTVEKTPILDSRFESSVPGLYFVGATAANSFGPVLRFAVGARFAARSLSRSLCELQSSE